MKNIGKYNGIPCYTCTNVEWKDLYDGGKDNGKQIFIIDGVMVCKNKIVGHYDGQHVKDRYDEVPYYKNEMKNRNEKSNQKMNEEPKTADIPVSSAIGETSREINFADYSKIVDEFFALLEA